MSETPWVTMDTSHPSCTLPSNVHDRGAYANDAMVFNGTDVSLDLKGAEHKDSCFGANTASTCPFYIKSVQSIRWSAKTQNCEDVWSAPLWMTPMGWTAPQCASGEIDFLERGECTQGKLQTSFGIWQDSCKPNETAYVVAVPYPSALDDTVRYYEMRVQTAANDTIDLDFFYRDHKQNDWIWAGVRKHYDTTHGWTDNKLYYFVSDVWNGGTGDIGYTYCGNKKDTRKTATCSYAVNDIKIIAKVNANVFSPTNVLYAKCNDWFLESPAPLLGFDGSRAGTPCHLDSPCCNMLSGGDPTIQQHPQQIYDPVDFAPAENLKFLLGILGVALLSCASAGCSRWQKPRRRPD